MALKKIPERKEKASNNLQIDCRRKESRCPTTPEDNIKYKKYRGIHKCWGCRYAYWLGSNDPYGPRELQRTQFAMIGEETRRVA